MRSLTLLCLLSLLFGCNSNADFGDSLSQGTQALVDGTPEVIGLLEFLNHPGTTEQVLDDEARLNRRSARNLVHHRDGWDKLPGTYDDNLFDDIAEVDEVRWVGPSALAALLDHALTQGWIPEGNDVLGSWDGVLFTVDEAAATLDLVNAASHDLLDEDLGLDKRAADSIVQAQPVSTVAQLSGLYYVGGRALETLRDAAAADTGTSAEGELCTDDLDCAEGLACMGHMVWDEGWCIQDWMVGTFSNNNPAAIPDNDPAGVSSEVQVQGLATVPVDILVTLDIDHPRPQDLLVTLFDGNGDQALLWRRDASPANPVVAWGIPGDDMVNGTWTLEVIDVTGGETGTLDGWSLYLTSNWD